MLRNVRNLYGHRVRAADGDLGKIYDFYYDDRDWRVRYLLVDTDRLLSGRRVPISPEALEQADWSADTVAVGLTTEQARHSPVLRIDEPVAGPQEGELRDYFRWPLYWNLGNPLTGGSAGAPQETVAYAATPPAHQAAGARSWADDQPAPILRSARRLIGLRVEANDGTVGSVDALLVDDETWLIRYVVVEAGRFLAGKKVLVAPPWILRVDWDGRAVHLDLGQETVRNSPEYDPGRPVVRDYETELFDHYGRPRYWRD